MFDPVDEHLATDYHDEGGNHFTCPVGQDSNVREYGTSADGNGIPEGFGGAFTAEDGETTNFNDVTECDNDEHEPEREALYNVGAGHLEEIIFFYLFEDGGFDFDKLVGEQQGKESVGI